MNADGSNQIQLTNMTADYTGSPTWSSDGKKISFVSNRDTSGDQFELYIMNNDGSDINKIVTSASIGYNGIQYSSWHPNGTIIVFSAAIGCCSGGVWIVYTNGSNLTQLHSGFTGDADWSADGTQIAYNPRANGLSYSHQLWTMNFDGSNKNLVTTACCSESTTVTGLDWGPNQNRIVLTWGHNIWTIDPDGLNKIQITFDGSYSHQYHHPAWSPDLTKIAFCDSGQVCVLDLITSDRDQLTTEGSNWSPNWSVSINTINCAGFEPPMADGPVKVSITEEPGGVVPHAGICAGAAG